LFELAMVICIECFASCNQLASSAWYPGGPKMADASQPKALRKLCEKF